MFAPTQKFIGIAPASLPARGAKEFAVATAAYQWVIAQGKPISGRDTTIESADVKKSHFHLFTPQIAFEYKIEHETKEYSKLFFLIQKGTRIHCKCFQV